jgi:AraC-like DNA-binding protein
LRTPVHRASERGAGPACGFDSISTFNRAFKTVTGVSPSEFRERAAQEAI